MNPVQAWAMMLLVLLLGDTGMSLTDEEYEQSLNLLKENPAGPSGPTPD